MRLNISNLHDLFDGACFFGQTLVLLRAEAKIHLEDGLRLQNQAGTALFCKDVDAAIQHGEPGELLLHDGTSAENVENRDDERVRPRDAARQGDGTIQPIILYADQHDVGRAVIVVHRAGLGRLYEDIAAMLRVQAQAVLLYSP